jgi:hypothetical protein
VARTNAGLVQGILGNDFDADRGGSALEPYIRAGNLFVNRVVTCAAGKRVTISDDELKEIEGWMSAHFYTKSDPVYQSKSTGRASGSFVRNPTTPEPYLDAAIMLDPSGCVVALAKRNVAGGFWLGKAPSEQTAYEDRR